MIKRLHHTAIIVSSEAGVEFYQELGFIEENRIDRGYDQIVWMTGYGEKLEVFIDSTHPARVTNPEALGLRHLAFLVDDVDSEWERLEAIQSGTNKKRKMTAKKVFFVKDPDGCRLKIRD